MVDVLVYLLCNDEEGVCPEDWMRSLVVDAAVIVNY